MRMCDYKLLQELAFDNQHVARMNYKLLFDLESVLRRDKSLLYKVKSLSFKSLNFFLPRTMLSKTMFFR